MRARTALVDRQFTAAEDDARLLLERYPGSPLKAAALGVRLAVAWELKRYRSAADLSAQLRAVLPAGRRVSNLDVLFGRLARLNTPVNVIMISEGLFLGRTPVTVADLSRRAAEARVTLHIIRPGGSMMPDASRARRIACGP